jgi:hypothetical protein
MTRNYEVRCQPIPPADVGGFQFYRDQYGTIIARCLNFRTGLIVTDKNADAARWGMFVRLLYRLPDCRCWRPWSEGKHRGEPTSRTNPSRRYRTAPSPG